MNQDSEHKYSEAGELRLEVLTDLPETGRSETDNDIKFRASVKNLLVLIKDFYGADSAAYYWFNLPRKQHKLLISSEYEDEILYLQKYGIGEDIITETCLKKEPVIYKAGNENERIRLAYRADISDVKTILAYPVLIEHEVIGTIICESKTEDFFAEPNIRTMSVFSESIANYIRYYSTYEEFFYHDKILKFIGSGKLTTEKDVCEMLGSIIAKFIDYKNLYFVLAHGYGFKVLGSSENGSEKSVDEKSLTAQAIKSKKLTGYNFKTGVTNEFRFYKDEKFGRDSEFTAIPVYAGYKCIGALCVDTVNQININKSFFFTIYKLLLPAFLYLNELRRKVNETGELIDEGSDFYNKKFFDKLLSSEINRCRRYNEYNTFVVFLRVDNTDSEKELIAEVFKFIKDYFSGFEMLFRTDNNKIAMLVNADNADKIYLDYEKMRKELSSKIIKIENKEYIPSLSIVIKRVDAQTVLKENILNEIDKMLIICENEGGNTVKIIT